MCQIFQLKIFIKKMKIKIINYILNNLEGGVDAFKHKKKIYSMYLNK